MKKLEIVNLYKHNIVYKNIKNLHKKQMIISLIVCIISVFSFCYLSVVNNDIKKSVGVFNPISELYRDVETASFVSAGTINFIVPIKTEKYNINLNSIDFEVGASIVVCAPADGIVAEICDNKDGKKCIKIKHGEKLNSVINNVEIVGVKVNDFVKQGKTLATAKVGTVVNFSIIQDDKIVSGLYLNKSFIKWE